MDWDDESMALAVCGNESTPDNRCVRLGASCAYWHNGRGRFIVVIRCDGTANDAAA